MKREAILAGVLMVCMALLCSCFVSTVMATTEQVTLFSDTFSEDEVNYDNWATADEDLYQITSDQLDIQTTNYHVSLLPTEPLYLQTGYTNATLSFSCKMKLVADELNITSVALAVGDLNLIDQEDEYYGTFIGVGLINAWGSVSMYVEVKNSSWESGDYLDEMVDVDAESDTYYQVTIDINRTSGLADVELINIETGDTTTSHITDIAPIETDTELTFGVGGGYFTLGMFKKGNDNTPFIPAEVTLTTGYVDNVEVSTTKVTITPPVVIVDKSKEIGWWLAIIGSLVLFGTGVGWKWLKPRNLHWGTGVLGGVLITAGLLNYAYGYIKTIPYLIYHIL